MINNSMKRLIDNEHMISNGIVYNAKGDLTPGFAAANSFNATAPSTASITLNADGTITKTSNAGGTSGLSAWVENQATWVGSANYRLTWLAPTGSGSIGSPATAQAVQQTFPQTFSLTDNGPSSNRVWDVTIYNNNPGASVAQSALSIHLTAEGACFEGNTPVLMADNTQKLIKDIVVGDELAAYSVPNRIDESDPTWTTWEQGSLTGGFGTTSTVVGVAPRDVSAYYILNNDVKVTPGHMMLIFKQSTSTWQWVSVDNIAIGDLMYDNTDNTVAITSMVPMTDTITVYNINVENVDTFYVNMNGDLVVVHNLSL